MRKNVDQTHYIEAMVREVQRLKRLVEDLSRTALACHLTVDRVHLNSVCVEAMLGRQSQEKALTATHIEPFARLGISKCGRDVPRNSRDFRRIISRPVVSVAVLPDEFTGRI